MFVAAAVTFFIFKATIFLSTILHLNLFKYFYCIVIDKSYSNTSILHLLSTISLQIVLLLHNYSQQQKANFLFISIITTSTSTITRREKIDFNGLKKKA
jgi:hypothetical protein